MSSAFLRRLGQVLLLLFALLVLLLALLGVQGFRAYREATALRDRVQFASDQLHQPATGPVRAQQVTLAVADLRQRTERLRALTHGLTWRTGGLLPGVGTSLSTVATLTDVGDGLADRLLPLGGDVASEVVRGPRTGPFDLRPLTARAAEVQVARREVQRAQRRLAGLDGDEPVAAFAVPRLVPRLAQADAALQQVAALARLGGPLTGEQGARRYLVVLQSPAESRATGGLVGGFVELRIRNGAVDVVRQGTKHQLADWASALPTVGGGFEQTWGPYGVLDGWTSSNVSADFPAVARLWRARYDEQYGGRLDGVVGMTPESLSGLLQLTGPLDLGTGSPVSASELPRLLEASIYERFPREQDEDARDANQLDVLERLVAAALRPLDLGPELLDAARTVSDGGVRLESAHMDEQAWFGESSVGAALPRSSGPFVAWTTQSAGGSKLDVYLHRTLTYRRGAPAGGRQQVTATADLRNDAPRTGLPEYVTISPKRSVVPGTSQLLVATYLSPGAQVRTVLVNGRTVTPRLGSEQGHPVVLVPVDIAPAGGRLRVQVVAEEPASTAPLRTLRQPTAVPDVEHLSG